MHEFHGHRDFVAAGRSVDSPEKRGARRSRLRVLIVLATTVALVGMHATLPARATTAMPHATPVSVARVASDPTSPLPTSPVELVNLRTAMSDTFALPNGDLDAVVYAGPVNYLDPQSKSYQPIDATLVDASAQGYAYTNRANSYSLLLPDDLSAVIVGAAALIYAIDATACDINGTYYYGYFCGVF